MIQVDITSKSFAGTQILGPIRFDVAAGETVAIVGPSGIGKSTLLRIVSGIDPDFEGRVTVPKSIAFVFQEPTLLPWRSALDNLILIHPNLTRAAAETALDRVGLSDKAGLFPGQLSLGQQRRLSLARAFAGEPDLLILDEPFASLDADTSQAMLALTESLIAQQRPATLLVTHDMKEAQRLAESILTLT
ncbi:MAG: ABC transporter ATP-binding protein, partial [Pseudomonadota bacterium]